MLSLPSDSPPPDEGRRHGQARERLFRDRELPLNIPGTHSGCAALDKVESLLTASEVFPVRSPADLFMGPGTEDVCRVITIVVAIV